MTGEENPTPTTPDVVRARAVETFGDPELARIWMDRPTTTLGGERPADLLDDEAGCQRVLEVLHRIAHGLAG